MSKYIKYLAQECLPDSELQIIILILVARCSLFKQLNHCTSLNALCFTVS